jgi:hypothetical protein
MVFFIGYVQILEEKRLLRAMFFFGKSLLLGIKKKAKNHTKELLGKKWHKFTIFRGEKMGFFKMLFCFFVL